jgi:TrmH family RNA methyltransferase
MISKSQIKYIQSLGQKKYRDEESLFIAEGPKLVKELLQNKNAQLRQLYALNDWIDENEELLSGIDGVKINETELERISQLKTPNQVIAIFKKFETKPPLVKAKIALVLDAIQDPGNVGTVIRIADWFGVSDIICSFDCADLYNPKVVQATMGSMARVNVLYTDLPAWLKQQNKVDIYAAMLEGQDVTKMDPLKEGLIIIGNESRGIHKDLLESVDQKITIPRKGSAESLNVAVAAGIILSHLSA